MSSTAIGLSGFDLLLEWASEMAEGSWAQWCEAARELRLEPNTVVRDFAALGHVEVDWTANRFSCPPPTAAYLHRSSGCILVTGARPRGFIEGLKALQDELDDLGFWVWPEFPQNHGPDTVLVEVELEDAEQLCEAAGLHWAFDPAGRIAAALPPASLETVAVREAWPPRDDVPRQRFNPVKMGYENERGTDQRGLWSYDGYRRSEAWLFDGETWWMFPTREYAVYLAHPDVTFLRYRETAAQLLVPLVAPLPPLQARAATLASGRLPMRGVSRGPASLAYENVSPELAERIANSLGTKLEQQA